jgi:hypothetical protein
MGATHPFTGWSSVPALLLIILALPALTGFAFARLAGPDTGSGMSPAGQGFVAGLCTTATTALLAAALALVTLALFHHNMPLERPTDGHCMTCGTASTVIPPGVWHAYRIGATITRATRAADLTLVLGLLFALFPLAIGAWLGELSLLIGNRTREPIPPPRTSPLEDP